MKSPSGHRPTLEAAEAARKMTRILVAIGRQRGHDDHTIRRDVLGAVREAIEGGGPCTQTMTVEGRLEVMVSAAGAFRLIFDEHGIDRADQRTQERWFVIAGHALDEALRGSTEDIRVQQLPEDFDSP